MQAQPDEVEAAGVDSSECLCRHRRALVDRQLDTGSINVRLLGGQVGQQASHGDGCLVAFDRQLEHGVAQVSLEVRRRPLGDHRAVVDDDDVLGEPVGLFEVLGGEEHGGATRNECLDHVPQGQSALWVEAGRRLVQKQDRRAGHESGGKVESTAHAA